MHKRTLSFLLLLLTQVTFGANTFEEKVGGLATSSRKALVKSIRQISIIDDERVEFLFKKVLARKVRYGNDGQVFIKSSGEWRHVIDNRLATGESLKTIRLNNLVRRTLASSIRF